MTLELVDGGSADADGVENGVIVDPVAMAVSATDDDGDNEDNEDEDGFEDTTGGGGSSGCFIQTALGTGSADNGRIAFLALILIGAAVVKYISRS